MNRRTLFRNPLPIALALLMSVALVVGCAKAPLPREGQLLGEEDRANEAVPDGAFGRTEKEVGRPMPTPALFVPGDAQESGGPDMPPLASPYHANRLIIKNAELKLLMEDVPSGVDRVTQVAADTFGYILSSRTWYQGGYAYATITIGVPVDEFESALRRLRGMAVRVQDETASGTDVSDQYVDLGSRLRNLEATEARVRSFLEQAQTVEESLRINQQLTEITAQIEEVKGRMSYLKDRAAYSTITVHLQPKMPAPTPTPPSDVWRPGRTFRQAADVLSSILRVVGDMAIWALVMVVPFAVPVALVLWMAIRAGQRRQKTE